ncbi:MAG: glycosyltransferase family 4 protein [Acidimicrobiales bacterium]
MPASPGDDRTGSEVRLLWVGHLHPDKRPDQFVELVGRLRADGTKVTGTVLGDGPMLESVRNAGAPGIEILGHRADVGAVMGGCDILVFCGRPAGEGMPGVLIEAGLCGLAVVTTDVPGAAEVVETGTTGVVVPHDDFSALVGAVSELVADPERRQRMGAAARSRTVEHFSLAASADQWRHLIAHLARQPPTGATWGRGATLERR